jgi:hypothetical protein
LLLFDYSIFRGKRVLAVDLDMSVVNNRERRQQAEERGRAMGIEVDYDFFYAEASLCLDRPMQGKLALLWRGLDVGMYDEGAYISSRPTFTWYSSAAWLHQYAYPFPFHLLLRRQFQKTIAFKREELAGIAAVAEQVYFVDDSETVRAGVVGVPRVSVYARLEDLFLELGIPLH